MTTLLSQANFAFRTGKHNIAVDFYKRFLKDNPHYPRTLTDYADSQLSRLDPKRLQRSTAPRVIVTCCNEKYFPSLLRLLGSIWDYAYNLVDEILVFDFGLSREQRDVISCKQKLTIFSVDPAIMSRPELARFKLEDPKTYFFKVYAFHFWRLHSRAARTGPANCLWLDSGVELNRSPGPIFDHINRDGYFFVDHSDTHTYYTSVQDRLVNVLSPSLFQGNHAKHKLPASRVLLKPYAKASIFGLQFGGPWHSLIKEHYRLCTHTDVLFDPRNISESKAQTFWLDNTDIREQIRSEGIDNSGKYLYGRHEQTVWGYLAALHDLTIHESGPYNATVAPGSGWLKASNYRKIIEPKLRSKLDTFRDGMASFLADHGHHNPIASTLSNEDLVGRYLEVSQQVYLDRPLFQSVGFPRTNEAAKSISLLTRGSTARLDEFKYSGKLLRHAADVRDDIFILMGNGPSLASVDFETLRPHHTFGLNAAYRAYHKLNFWPKYFGCFDALVCGHHAPEFKELILNSPIEKFFFINFDDNKRPTFPEPEIQNHPKFQRIDFRYRTDEEKKRDDILAVGFEPLMDMRTSGTNTIQCALLMGYRKILLLGCDANYVEYIDGAAKINNNPLKIKMDKTPDKNPNYWFDDYQQKGDVFNKPNLQISQLPAWDKLASTLQHLKIPAAIYNCSLESNISCFPKLELSAALDLLKKTTVESLGAFKCK